MLYVSTRDRTNTYTAYRALHEQCACNGGMFVPFRLPEFTQADILRMKENSFGSNVAHILNLFFSSRLTGWDVDFCCGRYPVNITSLPHKLLVAEAWRNTASSYAHIEQSLYNKLCEGNPPEEITCWAKIAIRIAVFFAVYAICIPGESTEELDFTVDDNSFIAPMAAWYARKMGLPVGTIICGSYDHSSLWDLIHRGELNTTTLPQNYGLEQLIYAVFGQDEVSRFISVCQNRRVYLLEEEMLEKIGARIFVSVVSAERVSSIISSFRRSYSYALDASAAIGFGALQDYRARNGESRSTVMFAMHNPSKSPN